MACSLQVLLLPVSTACMCLHQWVREGLEHGSRHVWRAAGNSMRGQDRPTMTKGMACTTRGPLCARGTSVTRGVSGCELPPITDLY